MDVEFAGWPYAGFWARERKVWMSERRRHLCKARGTWSHRSGVSAVGCITSFVFGVRPTGVGASYYNQGALINQYTYGYNHVVKIHSNKVGGNTPECVPLSGDKTS